MFLKTIGMRGFKSFADKTELVFTDGITSIVGPNGSGKSNISDAVKWVLGEQSIKNLRGGKMEDVIFAGTQFRKPVGLCQVSLTLDNTDKKLPIDYSDVTISRRLYRSGESEYYINNTQCRLKDINELFMDTGIGREGYSIIGQGNIESILNGKPEDRRGILEEAAGIVKFRWRKEESEKKLENTHINLLRIGDILESYRGRLEPLEIERKKANEFLKLSKKLREMKINMLIHSIEKLEDKIDKIKKSSESAEQDTKELNSEFVELKLNVSQLNEEMENLNRENTSRRKNYYENRERVQKASSDVKLLVQQTESIKKVIEKDMLELNVIEDKRVQNMQQKKIQEDTLSELKITKKEISDELEEQNNFVKIIEKSIEEKEDLYRNLKEDEIEHLRNISSLKNDIISIKKDIRDMTEKIQSMKTSCESYIHSIKINSNTKKMVLLKMDDIESRVKEYQFNIDENRKKILKLNEVFSSRQKKLSELNAVYNKLEANHTMLVNLKEHYEGYNRAARVLMMEIKKGKLHITENDCFLVGEVITLEKKFETCIEIALGSSISNIITKDEIMAKTLIKYLKNNNMGRATFLPLTTIKGKKILKSDRLKNVKGYIGIASDLLECKSGFKKIMEYILGRTIICSDMDSALKIAKLSGYSFKIVTLLGDMVNPGGSLTGGSIRKKNSSIIGRKREIEEISTNIKDIQVKIQNLKEKISDNKEAMTRNNEDVLSLKDKIYAENIEKTKMKGQIDNIEGENSKLLENINISNREIEIISKNKANKEVKLQEEEGNLKILYEKQSQNNKHILQMEEELKNKKKDSENKKESLTQLKIKIAKTDENILNRSQELKRLEEEIKELDSKKSNINMEIEKCRRDIHDCELKKVTNFKNIDNAKLKIEELQGIMEENNLKITRLKDNIKMNNEKLEDLAFVVNKKEQGLHKMQLSIAKLSTEKDNMYLKLKEDMEITYENALKYKNDIDNLNEYNEEILNLKNSISKLGAVNLGAIEEYDSLKEKVTFLSLQKEDLVKSKNELENVIDMMTEKMRMLFKKNFSKLRENFNSIFKELFNGGNADLILVNGDELTANIDITVQPPGKKLQNINLLSGGEKGLSAIALLFAILKIKPTPFCILDEIEAALDDANVMRYAKFLRKFAENTQFIIITHRKATMEVSDVMYGVTMEEKGISKIVSVDLKENY
ncbi:chromosome segregation protein SMC [Clostridium sp. MT-14]|uniref:chromosome segregation protein SMC n=1 Tax=Clostridium sp. MT-14 TaxID=3348360 RepID=UPI0035F43C34